MSTKIGFIKALGLLDTFFYTQYDIHIRIFARNQKGEIVNIWKLEEQNM